MKRMLAPEFRRIDEVFRRVCDLPKSEHETALQESCGTDMALASEVRRLLELDASLPAFARDEHIVSALERRAASALREGVTVAMAPERIAHFEVTGVLGCGGMGTVYRARQKHPQREVALKMLRQWIMTPQLVRRFEFEVDILARLQHPGIAQVYETGTFDDGSGARPYFAMELVDGAPLLSYANARGLDDRQRLALFVEVCRAVEHAHQKGVVHRDLKPANILITQAGDAKVLDFGIARSTDSDVQLTTMRTSAGDLLGTLAYMSPEQAAGSVQNVDTRSDVYSLGAVLYELLSGKLPHDLRGKSIPSAARTISDEPVLPLRTHHRRFAGDLDTIVAKAMEREPERRYSSAAALADDIERHLRDEPISARPPTTWEQWRRFGRRNTALAASLMLAFISLAAATGFSSWMAWRESRANAQAQANADAASKQAGRAERVKTLMVGMFAPLYPARPDGKVTVQDMLGQATERVRAELADQPDIADEMLFVLGTIYQNLDLPQFAIPLLEELLARQKARGVAPGEYVKTLDLLADVHNRDLSRAQAIEYQREVLEIHRSLGPATSNDAITALHGLAHLVTFNGNPIEGLRLAQEALALLDSIPDERPNQRFSVQLGIGTALLQSGRSAAAQIVFREILANRRHANSFWPKYYLAQALLNLSKATEALPILEPMAAEARADAEAEPRRLGMLLLLYSKALESAGRIEEAETIARESIEAFGNLDSAKLPNGLCQLASTLHMQGRNDETLDVINQSLDALRVNRCETEEAVQVLRRNARILVDMGKLDTARDAADRALAIVQGMNSPSQMSVARTCLAMANVELNSGQPDDAASMIQAALDALDDGEGPSHPQAELMRIKVQQTRALLDAGSNARAAAHLRHLITARFEVLQ